MSEATAKQKSSRPPAKVIAWFDCTPNAAPMIQKLPSIMAKKTMKRIIAGVLLKSRNVTTQRYHHEAVALEAQLPCGAHERATKVDDVPG